MRPQIQGRGAKVLLVEDERIVALDLKMSLEDMGYVVTGMGASEDEAVRMAIDHQPDMVLMDINLGAGGDGINAAQRIMTDLDIPVVYLTAYDTQETIDRANAVAPYGYLIKPVEMGDLHATIQVATARHRDQAMRQRLEQRLRLALDAAQMGVFEFHRHSDAITLDGHLPEHLGDLPRGFSMPREDFMSRFTAEDRTQFTALWQSGGVAHSVVRWSGWDEQPLWLEVHACHFESEQRVVGVFRDVTESVESANRLRQAAVVFESAAEAIAILDPEGAVISVNPAFQALTGWLGSEVVGRNADAFLHQRRAGDRSNSLTQGAQHGEVLCQRKDNTQFPAWEHTADVRDESGQVTHRVLSFSDISALRQAEVRIRHLAFHDPLTGMGNRHYLETLLIDWQAQFEAEGRGFGALFIDLDGFKVINDTLGHDQGDALLQILATRLGACLRADDFVARLGGDEFVVLARTTESDTLGALAAKLLSICRSPVTLDKGATVQVSASIGIATLPQHALTWGHLLKAADSAMYAAKVDGRDRIRFFSEDLAQQAMAQLSLEQGLRLALGSQQLRLHYQPVVDMRSGRLTGVEALLRWHSPDMGAVSPDRFIPVAEDTGLIVPIGAWVIDQALTQMARWRADGLPIPRMAVNVSVRQLREPGFAGELAERLLAHGLPAGCLEVEITESALHHVEHCQQRLADIQALGVQVALDDFGTGFSALSSLRDLPLNRLKVDKSFVRELGHNVRDAAILHAVVELGRSLNLGLTAEGVERPDQRSTLLAMGVTECQGWLYAKAMPPAELAAWAAQQHDPSALPLSLQT
ncbi:MAG: EAL domain-containing protein [Burkholderiales bacterium]|nr:EAL domain-containing protein [Burkholderiales bacterium]